MPKKLYLMGKLYMYLHGSLTSCLSIHTVYLICNVRARITFHIICWALGKVTDMSYVYVMLENFGFIIAIISMGIFHLTLVSLHVFHLTP